MVRKSWINAMTNALIGKEMQLRMIPKKWRNARGTPLHMTSFLGNLCLCIGMVVMNTIMSNTVVAYIDDLDYKDMFDFGGKLWLAGYLLGIAGYFGTCFTFSLPHGRNQALFHMRLFGLRNPEPTPYSGKKEITQYIPGKDGPILKKVGDRFAVVRDFVMDPIAWNDPKTAINPGLTAFTVKFVNCTLMMPWLANWIISAFFKVQETGDTMHYLWMFFLTLLVLLGVWIPSSLIFCNFLPLLIIGVPAKEPPYLTGDFSSNADDVEATAQWEGLVEDNALPEEITHAHSAATPVGMTL